jgi:hypothetical protein
MSLREYYNAWCEANPDKVIRDRSLDGRVAVALRHSRRRAKKYSQAPCITPRAIIIQAFTGRCHVCGVEEAACVKRLHMDHDHVTGEFRGWLCHPCHIMLGHLEKGIKLTTFSTPSRKYMTLFIRLGLRI